MDFMKMMSQMGEMKSKMEEAKKRLDSIFVVGKAEGIEVEMSASKSIKNITISDELVAEGDKEKLQDMITIAVGKALESADNVAASEMAAVSNEIMPGGLPPGLF